MRWRLPWRRHEPNGEHARQAQAQADQQLERARRLRASQVEQTVREAAAKAQQADRFTRTIEDAMRLRGSQ